MSSKKKEDLILALLIHYAVHTVNLVFFTSGLLRCFYATFKEFGDELVFSCRRAKAHL